MLYGTKCWAVKKQHIHKMRMLRWISGNAWKYRVRNKEIYLKIEVAPINEKKRESCLRWFGHV